MKKIVQWVRGNSLTIVFVTLFLATIAGQAWTGFAGYNDRLTAHGQGRIHLSGYLATGNFLDGIAANWQAAILQLGCLILFSGVLRQRGASHSIKADGDPEKTASKAKGSGGKGRARRSKATRVRKKKKNGGRTNSWLYRNSLSLAFGALFLGTFLAHIVFGARLYNETNAMEGQPLVSVWAFARSATFWFRTLQTWEAEFGVIAVFIVLSIFLRQEGSAESKPVESSDGETGETNK
ncbi:MAG: DUF6766 family protein [Chthoniobacterales bacterium]